MPNNQDWEELNSTSNANAFAKISLDSVSYWKNNYQNPILEIRLGEYFGDELGCVYWSSSETSEKINLVTINDKSLSIESEDKGTNINDVGFCIRCVKDDSK